LPSAQSPGFRADETSPRPTDVTWQLQSHTYAPYNPAMLVNKLTALDASDLRKLKKLAREYGHPVNALIRQAVKNYIKESEKRDERIFPYCEQKL